MEDEEDNAKNLDLDPAFEDLLTFIHATRGFDFTGYKRATLLRRVSKRMQEVGIKSYEDYEERLSESQHEFDELFNTVLINVTNFMRDTAAWDCLRTTVIPEILARKGEQEPIRIWSAGCASGQEAYSIAMLLAEACGQKRFEETVKIYATDIDEDALQQARQARFKASDVENSVPAPLFKKYFQLSDGVARFRKDLRRYVIFGRNDLLQDPPISRIDLLLCRNTLMYFNSEVQNKILNNFQFALRDGGYLFLGKSEVLLTREHALKPIDLKRRIFVKASGRRSSQKRVVMPPQQNPKPREIPEHHVQEHFIKATFEWSGAAEVVIDSAQVVSAINFQARELFALSNGDVGKQLKDLELSYRPVELRSLVEQVNDTGERVVVRGVKLQGRTEDCFVDVQVSPLLDEAGRYIGSTISFNDVTRYKELQDQLKASKFELERAYEELQSMVEELETTNEELQSTNEELETTNEELQSTNEELETMNEEMQSSNEELETINDELRSRTEDLHGANGFLGSILGSLHSAVAVLGSELEVLVWSSQAEELWGMRSDELTGKNFLNLDIGLPVQNLYPYLKACLADGSAYERVEVPAVNRRGRAINCLVQVSALRDEDDRESVTGVILVMEAADGDDVAAPEIDQS